MTDDVYVGPSLRTYVFAGVVAVFVGLGVMALLVIAVGVAAGLIGVAADGVAILKHGVSLLGIAFGVLAGRATGRWIVSACSRHR